MKITSCECFEKRAKNIAEKNNSKNARFSSISTDITIFDRDKKSYYSQSTVNMKYCPYCGKEIEVSNENN